MLMVEIVANAFMLIIALVVGGLILNRVMRRVVDNSFAKIARVESQYLDEQLRHLTE